MSEPTYFALVENDIIVGIYVADAEWVAEQDGVWIQSTSSNFAYKGGRVVDGLFVQPMIEPD